MVVGALTLELHLPGCRSLKDKRALLRPLLEAARQRHGVSAAEVGLPDVHQRTRLGFALVSGDGGQARRLLQRLERDLVERGPLLVVSRHRAMWRPLDEGSGGAIDEGPYAGDWSSWAREEGEST